MSAKPRPLLWSILILGPGTLVGVFAWAGEGFPAGAFTTGVVIIAVILLWIIPISFFAARAARKGRRYRGTPARPQRLMFLGGLPWSGAPAFDLPEVEPMAHSGPVNDEDKHQSSTVHSLPHAHIPHPHG